MADVSWRNSRRAMARYRQNGAGWIIWAGIVLAAALLVVLVDVATSGGDSPRAQISYVNLWASGQGAKLADLCASSNLKPGARFADLLGEAKLSYPNGNRLLRNAQLTINGEGDVTMNLVLEEIAQRRFLVVPITAIPAGREMVFGGRCANRSLDWKLLRSTVDKQYLPSGALKRG
jgi:hypothetical protein